jgi:peptidoglycan/xylan/chitin deacetylase (PgdA/CDA1 family)
MTRACIGVTSFGLLLFGHLASGWAAGATPAPVSVLLYHHISVAPPGTRVAQRSLHVPPALFRRQVSAMARAGYRAVTLDQVWAAWHGGRPIPSRAVVLSFDDGYEDQYRNAFPVLLARRWPGVLNLIVRNSYRGAISAMEVRRLLVAGWELDSHSLTHADLTRLDPVRLEEEISDSRDEIRRTFGAPVNFFAYPYGRVNDEVAAAVMNAGYVGAATTSSRPAGPYGDPARIPRISIGPKTTPKALVAKLRR